MTNRHRLDAAIGEHRLLDHPFYTAWRAGTLPTAAIASYAAEYGAFIAAIDQGWETVGQHDHAAEEREHAVLWDRFAAEFGTATTGEPAVPEVTALLAVARRLFAEPASAIGALYAFEVQQPDTAGEKLAGLAEHYGVAADAAASEYFRVHAGDYHEADDLVARLESADEATVNIAVDACAGTAAALYEALSGIQRASLS